MADIADVMDALEAIALGAVIPNGEGQPSVIAPRNVAVGQGWPLADDLDRKVGKDRFTLVSIYAVPSSTSEAGQPFNTEDQVVEPPKIGLTVASDEAGLTLSGDPIPAEYVTAETGSHQAYSVAAEIGDTAATMAGKLKDAIAVGYPGTTAVGSTVTIAPPPPRLRVEQGAPATLARRIHRQRTQFRISVWSPNPADRAKVARVIDVAVKSNIVIRLPDGTQGIVTYQGTNLDDKYEDEGTYRRDLIVNVTYDTTETYQAYVVTHVEVVVQPHG